MRTSLRQQGSTLVMALVSLLVLAFSAWTVFSYVSNRYVASFQSSSWDEALVVAESGVDMGMQAVNTSTWTGWTGTPSSSPTSYTYSGLLPAHTGDGNNKMYVNVTVDMNSLKDTSGNVWPRITSVGTTEVPGLHRVGYAPAMLSTTGVKNHNNLLRKIFFNTHSGVTVSALNFPQTSRTIQVVAQPAVSGLFKEAFLAVSSINMSGGSYTDSFDSGNSQYSTSVTYPTLPAPYNTMSFPGQYATSVRETTGGNIATNASGSLSDLRSSTVYGNAYSNGGTIANTSGVHGTVYNNFSTTIAPVLAPTLGPLVSGGPTTINNPNSTVTLTAGGTSQATGTNYQLSTLVVSNSSNPVVLANPNSNGADSYINIYVQGDLKTQGSGYIQQNPGVHATIWVGGNVTVSGSALMNMTGYAANLTIYGINPSGSSLNTYTVSGSGTFIGVVDAPAYSFTLSGSGSFIGAIIMHDATISGGAGYHYDQALARSGGATGSNYSVASWVENIP